LAGPPQAHPWRLASWWRAFPRTVRRGSTGSWQPTPNRQARFRHPNHPRRPCRRSQDPTRCHRLTQSHQTRTPKSGSAQRKLHRARPWDGACSERWTCGLLGSPLVRQNACPRQARKRGSAAHSSILRRRAPFGGTPGDPSNRRRIFALRAAANWWKLEAPQAVSPAERRHRPSSEEAARRATPYLTSSSRPPRGVRLGFERDSEPSPRPAAPVTPRAARRWL
jgi:hypothetical protein